MAGLTIAVFLVPMPYYVESPGAVRATQPLVTITGHRSYTSKGVVMFTTVTERKATPYWLLRAWLDETIDSIPEKVVDPKGDREAETRIEQQEMDRSKLTALTVAFAKLHLPLTVTGTGAFIQELLKGFPAEKLLRQGDVITAVDGSPVTTLDQVRPLLTGKPVGTDVTVTVRHRSDGSIDDVVVPLGRNEEDTSRGYLGVVLQTADEKVNLPFDINLDSGAVIGPSAGLAWTLGVIDRLTPGDLTHGKRVAVTGTIAADGSVGPIGGISQKVAGAIDEGATLFLYPASTERSEVKRMKAIAGDHITVKPVGSIDDALRVLDPSGLGAANA
ncbi:MAG: PDZ domain-containing protein [Acidimicrobiales bacterium]